jgi:hypothetical protein
MGFTIIVLGSSIYNEIFVMIQLGYDKEIQKLNFSVSSTGKEEIGIIGESTNDEESIED